MMNWTVLLAIVFEIDAPPRYLNFDTDAGLKKMVANIFYKLIA